MIKIHFFTVNPFQENAYVLYDESGECIIIDPGFSTASEEKLLVDFIQNNRLKPVKLINTHCHIDHILGNNFVAKQYGLKLEANELEIPMFERANDIAQLYGLPYTTSPAIEVLLNQGDIIRFGTSELEILFCPGHSPGSLVFYNATQKIAIGGDVLFYGSIGRTDLPGGNHATLIKSITTKLMSLPDDVRVYPGHGESTTIGFERQNNPFLI